MIVAARAAIAIAHERLPRRMRVLSLSVARRCSGRWDSAPEVPGLSSGPRPQLLRCIMRRSDKRILTTHTGSLPRTQKVVDLLLADMKKPGGHRAALDAAVTEAVAGVVEKQKQVGLDVINDGEQGR